MVPEPKQRSYFEIKAQLDAYRLTNPVTPQLKPPTINVLQEPAKSSVKLARITTIWNLWYVQFIITLLLWLLAIKIEFGAVFFIIGALYWIWVWGTTRNPKPHISNNPDEQIVSASFFFDNSPIPSNIMS
ncbi:unnamed protein product [Schistosoma margrebowiei]|uniref:SAYSvFN domain-containing protein n=1 Tax=Schistosoma margrebowiei TaxID=48269 RepID=A0AA84ZL49_9TREM|nr:unnamed protein product [Schistosoma margrebowiei]